MIFLANQDTYNIMPSSGGPYTLVIPSLSPQKGDLVLISLRVDSNVNISSTDFIEIGSYHRTDSPYLTHYLFAKVAGDSDPNYHFIISSYVQTCYTTKIFRGADQNYPIISARQDSCSGTYASISGLNLQQGSMVIAAVATTAGSVSSSDNWQGASTYTYNQIFWQIFGGASQTENPILFSSPYDNYWSIITAELKDANPVITNTIFINWLLTDEPGSKLWVKINGEWKPAKVTII
jgi:hypothetical protein